jgi:hypothetical protein
MHSLAPAGTKWMNSVDLKNHEITTDSHRFKLTEYLK